MKIRIEKPYLESLYRKLKFKEAYSLGNKDIRELREKLGELDELEETKKLTKLNKAIKDLRYLLDNDLDAYQQHKEALRLMKDLDNKDLEERHEKRLEELKNDYDTVTLGIGLIGKTKSEAIK